MLTSRRIIQTFFAFTVAAAGLVGSGCAAKRSSDVAVDAREAHRRAATDLILKATTADRAADKVAFALAAADQSNERIAGTVRAIDEARDVVVTNLANIETVAYKAKTVRVTGGKAEMYFNFEQGSLENTGRPLDVGIQGDGFFKVKHGDDVAYTRNGNFFVNNEGNLVLGMGDGYSLVPPLKVPPNTSEIAISQSGNVEAIVAGATEKQAFGTIPVARFANPNGLRYVGGSLFAATDAAGPVVIDDAGMNGAGQLVQGFLETSNVDLGRERSRLVFLDEWRAVLMASLRLDNRDPARAASPHASVSTLK